MNNKIRSSLPRMRVALSRAFGAAFLLIGLAQLPPLRSLVPRVPAVPLSRHQLGMAALTAFSLTHSAHRWGSAARAMGFALLVYTIVAVAETVGGRSVFGAPYHFDALHCTLGPPWLSGKPVAVPLAWYLSSYGPLCMADVLADGHVAVAALLTMATNVCSDPVMTSVGSRGWIDDGLYPEWAWHTLPGQWTWQGVPLANFGGWFVVSLLYFALWARWGASKSRRGSNADAIVVHACIGLFYVVHPVHNSAVRVTAALGMVAPAAAALLREWRNKKKP